MKISFILIISILVISCKKSNQIIISDNIKTFSQFPKEHEIEFKNLVEFKLGNPRQIITVDSTIILGNYARDQKYYLQNYSLSKGEFSNPYILKGRAKNEILGLANMGFSDNYLWLNDFTGKKMMLIGKDKVIKDSVINLVKTSFKTNRNFRSVLIDSLQIITTGNKKSKFKVQIKDLITGNVNEEFGELKYSSNELPLHIIKQASYTQTLLKPTKDKLVLAYINTDVIEVFDLKAKRSISIQGPEKFDSDFKIYNNVWFENENTRVAFIDGTATDKYIYLLYSGKKFSDKNAYTGNHLFIYDWNLNPIKKINLNKTVYQICVSDDDKTLYSFDEYSKHIVFADIN